MDTLMAILFLFVWIYTVHRNIKLMKSDELLLKYLESSPKWKIWINKYWIDKTIDLSKKYFLKIGLFVWILFILISTSLIGINILDKMIVS